MLRSADTAWFWKIVYDEKFAQYSPGVVLTFAVTEAPRRGYHAGPYQFLRRRRSSTIDHIRRERLTLCDRLIAVRPADPFASVRRLEMSRNAAIAATKARIRSQMHR